MVGGRVPVGMVRSEEAVMADNCATAASILARGWKKTLMIPKPGREADSRCSISFTAMVMPRCERKVMTSDISSGETPLKVQMTLTTGISISGRISVGMRWMASTPRIRIRSAMITNVYGRRNAS